MSQPPYHKYPPQMAPQEPTAQERIETRLTRMESRMVRLMDHLGLFADGTPKPEPIRAHRAPPFNKPHWTEK